jgi:hypothetical protein
MWWMARRSLWLAALSLAIATSSVAMSPSEQSSFDVALLPTSHPPYREIDALTANDENAVRNLVAADEAAGLIQILDLAARSRFEEQWAYIPAVGIWVEIGRNERSSDLDAEVEIDVDYVRSLLAHFPNVHIVHFHPASFYPVVLPAGSPAAAMTEDVATIGYALPSADDVLVSIRLMELLRADNPEVQVEFSVVSPHGLVTYGATEPGLATIVYEGNSPRAGTARSIVTRAAIRRMPFNITRTIAALGSPDIREVLADLCAQASDENYRLIYAPLVPAVELPVAMRLRATVRDLLAQ